MGPSLTQSILCYRGLTFFIGVPPANAPRSCDVCTAVEMMLPILIIVTTVTDSHMGESTIVDFSTAAVDVDIRMLSLFMSVL